MSSYKDDGKTAPFPHVKWREITQRRLTWLYGIERAVDISLGVDVDTNADLAKWNNLGRQSDEVEGRADR